MTLSPLLTDQTMLTVLIGTDRDFPAMTSKSGVLLSSRILAPVDAVG